MIANTIERWHGQLKTRPWISVFNHSHAPDGLQIMRAYHRKQAAASPVLPPSAHIRPRRLLEPVPSQMAANSFQPSPQAIQ